MTNPISLIKRPKVDEQPSGPYGPQSHQGPNVASTPRRPTPGQNFNKTRKPQDKPTLGRQHQRSHNKCPQGKLHLLQLWQTRPLRQRLPLQESKDQSSGLRPRIRGRIHRQRGPPRSCRINKGKHRGYVIRRKENIDCTNGRRRRATGFSNCLIRSALVR